MRTIPELAGAKILSDLADALSDVIPAKSNWEAFGTDASKYHVNVRVFRVVVRNRDPFKPGSQIRVHLRHQVSRQLPEIGSVAEFRRDDDLPETLTAGPLPMFELANDLS